MMLQELMLWPSKLDDGLQLADTFYDQVGGRLPRAIKLIAFVGMGGSGIAGRITKTFLDRQTSLVTTIVDSVDIPNHLDSQTLAFVISYSGNTWETINALQVLADRFIPTVVLAHGGRAAEIAQARGLPFVLLPSAGAPRAALGTFLGFLLGILDQLGLVGGKKIVQACIKHAEKYLIAFSDAAYFKDFIDQAKKYEFFHVWGVSGDSAAFAYRQQTQFNENSKVQAVSSVFPELCHNLLVGFSDCKVKPLVVLCHTEFLSANIVRGIDAAGEILRERGVALYKSPVLGDTFEAQVFNILLWSDFASYYLGQARGVDVDQVVLIDQLKAKQNQKGIR